MATKKVAVRLVAENGRRVRAEIEGIGDGGAAAFRRMSNEVDVAGVMLRRLAGIAAGALSIRQIIQYTDTWSELADRVDLATTSQEQSAAVMDELFAISRRTLSPIEDISDAWVRNARVLRELGLTTRQSLQFTEALSTAMDLSAIRGQRAEQMYNALSRAMASGQLRGAELNTVVENGGIVAEVLADELGIAVSQLREAGKQGRITGDVLQRAFITRLEELQAAAAGGTKTFRDGMEVMGNAVLRMVGTWDRLLGASSAVGEALVVLADNVERLASTAIAFAGFMAGRWVAAFVAAQVATFSLVGALTALRVALIRTGIGALIVAAGELVYWLTRVIGSAEATGDAFFRVFDVAKEVFLGIGRTAWGMSEILAGIASGIAGSFVRAFAEILKAWDAVANGIAATWNLIADTGFGEKLGLGILPRSDTSGAMGGIADALFTQAAASVRSGGGRIVDAMISIRDAMDRSLEGEGEIDTSALDEAAASAGRFEDALDDAGKAAGRAGAASRKAGKDAKAGAEDALQGWAAVAKSLDDYARDAMDLGKGLGDSLVGAFRSAENAIGDFVKRGKLDFRDLVSSMLADLAKLGARRFLLGPLASALSGALGGLNVPILHGGGMVGGAAPTRMVPAMAFAGAQRFHGGGWPGLRSDEVPAILQKGERVLSRREVANGGSGVTVNINARDAESFRQSRAQIASDIARAVSFGRRGM